MTLRVTFVIPWFDPQGRSGGGAETLCREYAERLSQNGHDVEVLSTCSRDHDASWYSNELPAETIAAPAGYRLTRFAVRSGSRDRFLELNRRILARQTLSFREERAFFENSVQSDGLAEAVASRVESRIVVALPYLFGLVWRVVMEYPARIVLCPCLHDEGYAYLKLTAEMFRRAGGFIFNSASEQQLAERRFGCHAPAEVVGIGLDLSHSPPPCPPGNDAPYLLYIGRQSVEKGLHHLVTLFRNLGTAGEVRLLLAGKGRLPGCDGNRIVNLGYVSEQRKRELIVGATAVVLPSRRESLSIAVLESLALGTPVLVDGRCGPAREHVINGQCGFWYETPAEFAQGVKRLLSDPRLQQQLGENGRAYVEQTCRWSQKLEKLTTFLDSWSRCPSGVAPLLELPGR